MSPGIIKLLDMIAKSPVESMLVDRVLVLASDVPEFERAEIALRLSKVLLDGNPRRSIEISWMLFKSGLRDFDALGIICDALERLNKPAKAKLIREELRRLKNDTLSDFARGAARETIEKQVTATLSGADDLEFAAVDEVTRTEARAAAAETDDTATPAPRAAVEVSPRETPDAEAKPKSNLYDPEIVARRARISRINRVTGAEGIPEAIPPKEPSLHQEQGTSIIRAEVTRHSVRRTFTPQELRQRLIDLVTAEEWEMVLEHLAKTSADEARGDLLSLFEERKLWRIDIRFAMWWMDILKDCREERRALRFALRQLAEEPHLAWARQIYPRVVEIASTMGFDPPSWRESEGVAALRHQIASLHPAGGQYWVKSGRRAG